MSTPLHASAGLPGSADVLVVGAGPAGLAIARQLRRRGLQPLVIDAEKPASSWRSMPPALRLVSPWWTNALRWRDVFRHPPFAMVGADDFTAYLDDFRENEGIPVIENCAANSIVSRPDGGFDVLTARGTVRARLVVCGTGYFSRPAPPVPAPQDDGSVPTIHAARYPGPVEASRLAAGRAVVIVGRRVSAGQLMTELADHGSRVVLSIRAQVEFRRDGWRGSVKDALYYFYEEFLVLGKPRLRLPSFPVMDGGRARELFEQGRIDVYPPIRRIVDGEVEFDDGRRLAAGLVIWATGYLPALPALPAGTSDVDGLPLCDDWESRDSPGLFFLGLDNRRNYRSRTLRGIRRDAVVLSRLIAERLRATPSAQPRDA